jgi:phenylcoumaran benzylic ether reductase
VITARYHIVQRFLPSEFGMDGDRTGAVEPAKSILAGKTAIRRAVEAAGVPYTYVVAGYFAGYTLPGIGQALSRAPPTDEAVVLGDDSVKAVFVEEGDIATYTVLAAADPRAENKTMYMKPPANTLSHNELLDLWERKAGRAFERVYVPEDAVLKQIQESPIPMSIVLAIAHAGYVRGATTGFEIDPVSGVDATELYPDVKYTTVDEYLNRFL